MIPVLKQSVSGLNAAVVMFGQSLSGRSHTLHGRSGISGGAKPGADAGSGGASSAAQPFGDGVMDMSADALFAFLNQKMTAKPAAAGAEAGAAANSINARYDNRKNTFSVTVQYVEIYDDTYHDLLVHSAPVGGAAAAGSKLDSKYGSGGAGGGGGAAAAPTGSGTVKLTAEYGPDGLYISGLSRKPVSSPDQLHVILAYARANRASARSPHGPYRELGSEFCWFDIEQRLAPTFAPIRSRVWFVILPATDRLSVGSITAARAEMNALRVKEGGRVTREVIGTGNLIRALAIHNSLSGAGGAGGGGGGAMGMGGAAGVASSQQAASAGGSVTIDYSESKTTACLEDILGGNCSTLVVATVSAHDSSASSGSGGGARATLDYALALSKIHNFPIRNDERSVGALRRLRTKIGELRLQLKMERFESGGGLGGGGGPMDQDAKDGVILELKSSLQHSDMAVAKLERDQQMLYDRYTQFRTKYSELVDAKTALTSQWMQSEEQRLKLAKLAIDLQIENTDLKESAAKERYEFENQILRLEHSSVDANTSSSKYADQIAALHTDLTRSLEEKSELASEYVSLRDNYALATSELDTLKSKNEHLSTELLTLVNQIAVLESSEKELHALSQSLQQKNDELSTSSKVLTEVTNKYTALKKEYDLLMASGGGNGSGPGQAAAQTIATLNRSIREMNDQIDQLHRENDALKASGLSSEAVERMKAEYAASQAETRRTIAFLTEALADVKDSRSLPVSRDERTHSTQIQNKFTEFQSSTQRKVCTGWKGSTD